MAARLTSKQEAFCLAYVETGNASEAYRRCYNWKKMKPASVNRKAFELMENVKITARIAELQQSHAERHDVTVDTLTETLLEAIQLAKSEGQSAAIVSAVKEMGILHGVRVEKKQNENRNTNMYESMPDDELEREAVRQAGIIARNAASGGDDPKAGSQKPDPVH